MRRSYDKKLHEKYKPADIKSVKFVISVYDVGRIGSISQAEYSNVVSEETIKGYVDQYIKQSS